MALLLLRVINVKVDGGTATVVVKRQFQGEVIRLTMISTHYRQPLNWTRITSMKVKKH